MNCNGRPQTRLQRPLDPGMVKRGMFAREIDATFGTYDFVVEQGLLARVEESERAARKFIVVPHPGCADLEFFQHLRMDLCDVLQGLKDPVVGPQRTPALRIL